MTDERQHTAPSTSGTQQFRVPVYGMTCDGCAASVRNGLSGLAGVSDVDVRLDDAEVLVTGEPDVVDEAALRDRVEAVGFHLEPPPEIPPRWRWKLAAVVVVALGAIGVGFWAFQQVSSVAEGADQLQATFAAASAAAFLLAFTLGVIVAFAPSSLAMTPAVIGYVTGSHTRSTTGALRMSGAFVLGVLVVNAAIGAAAALGGRAAIIALEDRLALWFALMVLALGVLAVINLGVWRPRLPSFVPRARAGEAGGARGAFLVGVPFGLLACPSCTPLLLPVLFGAVATGNPLYGAGLVAAFGLGRGLPLVALGTLAGAARAAQALTRWVPRIEKAVGVLLLLAAVYFLVLFVWALTTPYEPQGFLAVAGG